MASNPFSRTRRRARAAVRAQVREQRRQAGRQKRAVRRHRWFAGAASLLQPPRRARTGWVALGAVTLALFWIAFGTAPSAYDMTQITWGAAPFIAAAAALPLLLAPRAPLTGWITSAAAAMGMWVLLPAAPGSVDLGVDELGEPIASGSPWPWLVVHTLVLLALLAALSYRAAPLVLVGAWAGTTLLLAGGTDTGFAGGWVTATTTVAVAGWLAGRLARSRQALQRETRLRSEEASARVLLEERARIARDLHDIVAHRMSLVAVQAETARFRRPGLPPEAVEELAQISATAREALAETRTLLGVLRNDADPVATAPQPGVEDLPGLVQGTRRAGLSLEDEIDCPAEGLGANTSLTVYRVAQEALSNVARHAPGASTRLEVRRGPAQVQVLVRNGPASGTPAPRLPGPAHGLTGMRERVGSAGGTVTTGATEDGGYEVLAVLPAPALTAVPPDGTAPAGQTDDKVGA